MWYQSFGKVLTVVIVSILTLGLVAFGLMVFAQYRGLQSPTTNTSLANSVAGLSNTNTTQQFSAVTPTADNDPSLGPASAPVQIIAFEDFQCPYCKTAEPIILSILEQYPTQVQFVYRDFPLYTIHPQARVAANAGECANEQGKFWAWHDQAFTNQDQIAAQPAIFNTWAQTAGLDVASFSKCVSENRYATEVQKDLDDGLLAGVSATPTFFIQGQKVEGVLTVDQWKQLIEAALAK